MHKIAAREVMNLEYDNDCTSFDKLPWTDTYCFQHAIKPMHLRFTLKKVSFDSLKEHIYKVVDKRLELLTKIAKVSSKMIEKVVDYIRNEAVKRFDGQIQMYVIREVKDLT